MTASAFEPRKQNTKQGSPASPAQRDRACAARAGQHVKVKWIGAMAIIALQAMKALRRFCSLRVIRDASPSHIRVGMTRGQRGHEP